MMELNGFNPHLFSVYLHHAVFLVVQALALHYG